MHGRKIKIAIITNIITSYREGYYDCLFKKENLDVTVYCQDHMPGMNVSSIHKKYGNRIKIVKFISAKREKIAWQFLPWREIFRNYDVVFVGGNPRVLSDMTISTALHFAGKGVVHWTMAHSFRANTFTENVRLFWARLFKFIFVYTDSEVEYLHSRGFKNNFILGMNNGLDQKKIDSIAVTWPKERLNEWMVLNKLENRILLLSCARLNEKNKFELVLQALPEIVAQFPSLIWCVIGDGNNKIQLEAAVKYFGLSNHVLFVGALYEEDKLAPWFLSSEIFIHPAAIGLSLLHAFGYGLPVITHGQAEYHGPEYAAFRPEHTGRNFNYGNAKHLAKVVIDLLRDKRLRISMKEHVLRIAREKYNVDVMTERFVQIAKRVVNDKNSN